MTNRTVVVNARSRLRSQGQIIRRLREENARLRAQIDRYEKNESLASKDFSLDAIRSWQRFWAQHPEQVPKPRKGDIPIDD